MKKYFLIVAMFLLTSCQTINIKDRAFKVSNATTEIGSIGFSKSLYIKNEFSTRVFPILKSKIRVDINIVPFNKKLNKIYINKAKFNQNQAEIKYIDSLNSKPEILIISILDISEYTNQLNSEVNKNVIQYLKDTKNAKVITSIATTLSDDYISKIRQADTFYLTNSQEKKYTLVLYKDNKKGESINLQSGVVLGYELSKCCWTINSKHNWYLADIINERKVCKGNTYPRIKKKKREKSLFKM